VAHLGKVGRVLVKVLRQQQRLVDARAAGGGFAEVSGGALGGEGLREARLHPFLCAGEGVVHRARVAKVGFHALASDDGDGVLGGGQRDRETGRTNLWGRGQARRGKHFALDVYERAMVSTCMRTFSLRM
jgi:hypothetical protein